MNTTKKYLLAGLLAVLAPAVTLAQANLGSPQYSPPGGHVTRSSPVVIPKAITRLPQVGAAQQGPETLPVAPAPQVMPIPNHVNGNGGSCPPGGCAPQHGCGHHGMCYFLKPWTCDDLVMEPAEHKCHCCCGCGPCGWLHSLLYCPEEPEEEEPAAEGNGNGNGNGAKNGNGKNGNGKNGKKKNGNGNGKNANGNGAKNGNGNGKNGEAKEEEEEEEEEAEEAVLPAPFMHSIWVHCPSLYRCMDCGGHNIYGWFQGGFTYNPDHPADHRNFGVNYNDRSNGWLFNQLYVVFEKKVTQDPWFQWGYRVDFYGGHDAALNTAVQTGWFNRVNGNGPFVQDGTLLFESGRPNQFGVDQPQAFLSFHLPCFTKKGLDIDIGHFYTLMGAEVIPAPLTDFYSHQYEFFYGIPFYHTGMMTRLYVGDTVTLHNCLVRGWDDFYADDNDSWSYLGGIVWNNCDATQNLTVTWITGPEQYQNDHDYRTQIIAYYQKIFGSHNQWRFKFGGNYAWEDQTTGTVPNQTRWYGCTGYLFYTCDPSLILGMRAEWFADPNGVRTGFKDDFHEVTVGFTYKPYQNLRIRPELRYDWASHTTPYDDQTDRNQFTAAFDIIYEW